MKSFGAGIVLLFVGTASAQAPTPGMFAAITRLDCIFTAAASVTWVEGRPRVDVRRGQALRFRLGDIDTNGGTAHFSYGAQTVPIVATRAGSTLTFIDRRLDGSMAMTTVLAAPGRGGKFRAAYSRTEYYAYDGPGFASVPQAEQSFGYCDSAGR